MTVKERFRRWQRQPAGYNTESRETHLCNNCGREYCGNYCPTCGQKWDTGPVSWSNLRQQWMAQWGLGTRSLPLTIMQLFLRPGYLIGEYISGKQRNCFPPFSMLVLVAVAVSMIGKGLGLEYVGDSEITQVNPTPIGNFRNWLGANMDYGPLFFFLLMIGPTYIIFRYAPRHTRHTLPQGFFIQVFNATQFILLLLMMGLVCRLLGLTGTAQNIANAMLFLLLVPSFLFLSYKQLFGYSVWGTIWRSVCCYVIMLYLFYLIIVCADVFFYGVQVQDITPENVHRKAIVMLAIIIFILCGATFINRRGYLRRKKPPLTSLKGRENKMVNSK